MTMMMIPKIQRNIMNIKRDTASTQKRNRHKRKIRIRVKTKVKIKNPIMIIPITAILMNTVILKHQATQVKETQNTHIIDIHKTLI